MNIQTISQTTELDEQRATLMSLQALVDLTMLSILSALMPGEQPLDQLAATLKLQPSLQRGPIARLVFLEFIQLSERSGQTICRLNKQRFHQLNGGLQQLSKQLLTKPETPRSSDFAADEQRVFKAFMRGDQITSIPIDEKRQRIILQWLVERFDPEQRYPEREVNEIIKAHHPDFATLRRALIDYGFMQREREIYWRIPPQATENAE